MGVGRGVNRGGNVDWGSRKKGEKGAEFGHLQYKMIGEERRC